MNAASRRLRLFAPAATFAIAMCAGAGAQPPDGQPAWPDTFVSRLAALALVETLHGEILSSTSATATLEQWCRDHDLARPPRIVARLNRGGAPPATAEQRRHLQVGAAERVLARSVDLRCGDVLLSKARNWYVPGRLTSEMNRLLETTETPFGTVIRPLQPYRQTIAAEMLWHPLPPGWEHAAPGAAPRPRASALEMPEALFEHHAIVFARDHAPLSEVDEVYQRGVLSFSVTAR
jgi:hypothetical protein